MKLLSLFPGILKFSNGCILLLSILFIACDDAPETTSKSSGQEVIEKPAAPEFVLPSDDSIHFYVKSLIEISAEDFLKNMEPLPTSFRDIQVKYFLNSSGEVNFMICGEFRPGKKDTTEEWIHFTTIKNTDYEQWIGESGITFCENAIDIPYTRSDLSVELIQQIMILK